jgi:hypothetical protein
MAKLVINQPGYFVTVPSIGSFRSPFKIKFPDSLTDLVKAELLKNGVRDFKIETTEDKQVSVEQKETFKTEIILPDFVKILERLNNIELLIKDVVLKEPVEIRSNIEKRLSKLLGEEEEIFIPSLEKISEIDLEVRTSKKDDVSNRVDSLSELMDEKKGRIKNE